MMNSSITNILQALKIVTPTNKQTKPKSYQRLNSRETRLREISLDEVAQHDSYQDCWIAIYDRVYNVTSFLHSHPGGENIIIDYAGRDATLAFHGTGHSSDAILEMRNYIIGELPLQQRIFRVPEGYESVLSMEIPE